MVDLLNYVFNAAAISALYALVAIGFTLIFGVGNILNFAHGAFITFGAFVAYVISNQNQMAMSPWLGLAVAAFATAVLGGVFYKTIIQYVENRPVTVLILTLVAGFFIQHTLRIFIGGGGISVPRPAAGQLQLAGETVQYHFALIFVASWLIIGGLFLFINYTKTGKALLATSMTQKGAALVGIESDKINLYTWVTAAALAGFAGVLLAGFEGGGWNMGLDPMVLSFSIVILGGLGSIRGSIVGAYIIGFIETATTQFISTELTGLASLVLLIAVLLVRPSGLFGREVPT